VNHLDQIRETECLVCDAYRNATLSPSEAPQLSWQSRLTQMVRQADAVLSPATPDSILSSLNEIAPIIITGFGPTSEERTLTELPFSVRRNKG
jgi:hypothetical protein